RSTPLPGCPGVRGIDVTRESWRRAALDLAAAGGRLLSLWADAQPPVVHAAIQCDATLVVLHLSLPDAGATYPSLADVHPPAQRMQRAAADMTGIRSADEDTRPWLRHAAWPAEYLPLGGTPAPVSGRQTVADAYPFLRVVGDGVHEIPVGPV